MKKIALYSIILLYTFCIIFSCNTAEKASNTAVDYKQAYLVDVRTKEEFSNGSVPGAVNIPLDQLEQNLDSFQNKKQIVLFCRSGNRSNQAKQILEKKGVTNCVNGGSWEQVNEQMTK